MAKEFAEQEPDPKYRTFSASSGWMQNLMKRNGISNVNSPWIISNLEGAEEAMEELASFAKAKGMTPQDMQLLTEFGQKLRHKVAMEQGNSTTNKKNDPASFLRRL